MAHEINPQDEVDTLLSNIKSGGFDRIDIICIPSSVESVMRINQEALEKSFFYKISMREIAATYYWDDLINELNSTEVGVINDLKDLRCGVTFYKGEVKIVSLYYDEKGRCGAINSTPVVFKGGLYDWIRNNFLKIVK
ncbi:TPA: hypothetical protein R5S02_004519 [Salmonella enterica]|nr:hypothetical protein [Salmonella enterica]